MSTQLPPSLSKKSQSPHVHHMVQVVNDHNHTTNIGKDGMTRTKPTHGTKGKLIQMSPRPDDLAGKTTLNINTENARSMKAAKNTLRKYHQSAERDRALHYTQLQVKDNNYYNKKDSLWNEPQRLDKKFANYSEQNIDPTTTFKQSITDLPQIKQREQEIQFQNTFKKLMQVKKEDAERYMNRKMERYVWQYQASQGLTEEEIAYVQNLAQEAPQLFQELAAKKKWTYANKNPDRAVKLQNHNNKYWNLMNNLPKRKVSQLVTDRILDMDKKTCESLIQNILEEKKVEDNCKNIRKLERLIHRNKTVEKHNQSLEYLSKIGVKVRDNSRQRQNGTMQSTSYRNQQEFSDFNNSHVHQTSARVNNSTLVGDRSDSPMLNTEVQKANQFIEETNDYLSKQNTPQKPNEFSFQQSQMNNTMSKFDKYGYDQLSQFSESKIGMKTQYASPKSYKTSERTEILSMPKHQYHGKCFFERQEFRDLFLADHQEALGKKAYQCVDQLNNTTVTQFNDVSSFKDSIGARKTQEQFYKSNTRVKPFVTSSYKQRFIQKSSTADEMTRNESGAKEHTLSTGSPLRKSTQMEASASKEDNHLTLEMEKSRMAQTFQAIGSKDKFLPQMVQTPLSNYTQQQLMAHPQSPLNQTQPAGFFKAISPYKSKNSKNISIQDGRSNPFDFATKLVQDYTDDLAYEEQKELEKKFLVTQIPKNGSKIDFKLGSPKTFQKNTRNIRVHSDLVDLNTAYKVKKQIWPLPTMDAEKIAMPNPKHLMGLGYQHNSVSLTCNGASNTTKGVFTNTNKSPILVMNDQKTEVSPPSLNRFIFTGQILSENPTTSSVITEIYSQNGVTQHYKSKNPFQPTGSSPGSISPRSPNGHFDSDRAKASLKEVMHNQDSGQIFQTKNLLAADPNAEHINTQDMKSSIKKRKKSVFQ